MNQGSTWDHFNTPMVCHMCELCPNVPLFNVCFGVGRVRIAVAHPSDVSMAREREMFHRHRDPLLIESNIQGSKYSVDVVQVSELAEEVGRRPS